MQWGTAGQTAIVQGGFKNTSLVINNTQLLFKRSTVAVKPAHLTSDRIYNFFKDPSAVC